MDYILIYDPKAAKKIVRCCFCIKATRTEFFLGDRAICPDCKARLERQRPNVERTTRKRYEILRRHQAGESVKAIATGLGTSQASCHSHLSEPVGKGLVSVPVQEDTVTRYDRKGHPQKLTPRQGELFDLSQDFLGDPDCLGKLAERMGVSKKHTRDGLRYLESLGMDVPRIPRKKAGRKANQLSADLTPLDERILAIAEYYLEDPSFLSNISATLGVKVGVVGRRLRRLKSLGYNVPSRGGQKRRRIVEILSRATKGLPAWKIARDLKMSPSSINSTIRFDRPLRFRSGSLSEGIYCYLNTPRRREDVIAHFLSQGRTKPSIERSLRRLKSEGLLEESKGVWAIAVVRHAN